jgi:hypothetical protein
MTDFRSRIQRAVNSGKGADRGRAAEKREARQAGRKIRELHENFDGELRPHIHTCLEELNREFPAFDMQEVYNEKGRGYALARDDAIRGGSERRDRYYSRLEIYVHHFKDHGYLEVSAKGSIRNKEKYERSEDDRLETLEIDLFKRFVERVVVEYAHDFADDDETRS